MVKHYITLISICCFLSYTYAQYTNIPDSNFEKVLIDLGYDTGYADQKVLTSSISGIISLDIRPTNIYAKINDLTGIEDFASLETLICDGNSLTTIDLSKNTALKKINCAQNQLISLNLIGAVNLESVYCDLNQLTNLDVSQNLKLNYIKCFSNRLTSLDLSSNTMLTYIKCDANPLTSLNVKNGNNSIITKFDATPNATLNCIDVDDATAANAGLSPYLTTIWVKDDATTYSEDCSALSINNEKIKKSITFHPNPFTDILSIDSKIFELNKIEFYSISGMKIKVIFSNFESINTSNLSQGVYILKIHTLKGSVFIKLIKH
jgi:hypothetical protein